MLPTLETRTGCSDETDVTADVPQETALTEQTAETTEPPEPPVIIELPEEPAERQWRSERSGSITIRQTMT